MASKDKAKSDKKKEKEKMEKAKAAAAAAKAKEAAAKQKAKEKAAKEKEKAALAAAKAKEAAAKKKPVTPSKAPAVAEKKAEPKAAAAAEKQKVQGGKAAQAGATVGKAKDLLRAIAGGKSLPSGKEEAPADTRRTAAGVENLKRVAGATIVQQKAAQPEQPADAEGEAGPLLDLSDAAVKKMIKAAKKRGYVTYDQLNDVMPSEEVTSEQIEDVLAMMNDMGINVVEAEDTDGEEEEDDDDEDDENDAKVDNRGKRRNEALYWRRHMEALGGEFEPIGKAFEALSAEQERELTAHYLRAKLGDGAIRTGFS